MKIYINKQGCLDIERRGIRRPQYCRFAERIRIVTESGTSYHDPVSCSHSCPLFGEPEGIGSLYNNFPNATLSICHKVLRGEIIDERK
jgi:hypothetical protein